MKPGDLVRLTIDPFQGQTVVYVASIPSGGQWAFDDGTAALVLGEHLDAAVSMKINDRKLKILVEGRLGWVFESECEVISEPG